MICIHRADLYAGDRPWVMMDILAIIDPINMLARIEYFDRTV